jgi:hypothetical protein
MSDGEQKKVQILNVRTLPHCPSYVLPQPFGPVIKTSVVLSELFVQINVEADIDLCDEAIEIKREKKEIEIVQCELLLNTNTVFIGGFVNKNVEYATGYCGCAPVPGDGGEPKQGGFDHNICGQIKHCLVKIPFECTAEIPFGSSPFGYPSSTDEYHFSTMKCAKKKTPKKEFVSTVFINEKPFGEPIAAYMVDEIIHPHEKPFHKFTEKMVVVVLLKIMQNRQVPLNGFFPGAAGLNVMPNQPKLASSPQTAAPAGIIGELIEVLEDAED